MKKLFLFLVFLYYTGISMVCTAQTQRMVLYEGFSNASCGPCAAQNPITNALIAANYAKVVPIKYQVNWPGTDPMNAQTQTWVGPRVTYYNVQGVPATRTDGTTTSISQTIINNRYAVPSPFFLEVNHTFNTAKDSAFIEVQIKAAQNYTGSQLVLHTAMVEKHINFATPPGSNGETDFYHVMRRMYPNASGTSLPSTWTLGQVQTYNFAVPVPTYIYKFEQIAFVAFIQTNSDKSVLQAAKTILNRYITIYSHNIPVEPGCYDQFAFQLNILNQGKTQITSFNIEYGVVGQPAQVYNWTGTLNWGQTTAVTLPPITISGVQTVFAEVKNPNGFTNDSNIDTKVEGKIPNIAGYTSIPVFQGFTSTSFPPTNWHVVSNDNLKWERHTAGGFGGSPGGSARIRFYNSPNDEVDILYMEGLNLTTPGSLVLTFSVAHAMYDATYGPNDRLQVQISTNCGQTWTTLYNKAGSTLATAPNTTSSFVPTSAQWRKETISLSGYTSQNEVLIRFRATSGYGNNLYIDDINIIQPVETEEYKLTGFASVYPNPAADIVNIEIVLNNTSDIIVNIFDITGKNVCSFVISDHRQGEQIIIPVDASAWSAGLYNVVITADDKTSLHKILKK